LGQAVWHKKISKYTLSCEAPELSTFATSDVVFFAFVRRPLMLWVVAVREFRV
jgi:hypothetical protein